MEPKSYQVKYVRYCHYEQSLDPTQLAIMALEEIGKEEYERIIKEGN